MRKTVRASSLAMHFLLVCQLTGTMGQERKKEDTGILVRSDVKELLSAQSRFVRDEVALLRTEMAHVADLIRNQLPLDCSGAKLRGDWGTTTTIKPPGLSPRTVRCDQSTEGGGWTVVVHRMAGQQQMLNGRQKREESPIQKREGSSIEKKDSLICKKEASPTQTRKNSTQNREVNPIQKRESPIRKREANRERSVPSRRGYNALGRRPTPSQSSGLRSREYGNYIPHNISEEEDVLNFNRTWTEYKDGFGDPKNEYWIGNEVLHALTGGRDQPWEAAVVLEDWSGRKGYAFWNSFRVLGEAQNYKLEILGYDSSKSTSGDGLAYHSGRSFSTIDADNDEYKEHCARKYGGGWWFHQCHVSHLTGTHLEPGTEAEHAVHWLPWKRSKEALKSAALMIRPQDTKVPLS